MWGVVSGIIQIIFLVLKNRFEKDAELKRKREELRSEVNEAVKSRDAGRINRVVNRLREP
mgnify:CR=1 FL=1